MQSTLFVGIDVSLKTNVVCILDSQGKKLDRFSVHNDREGAASLAQRACSHLLKAESRPQIRFGIEATSVYGMPLLFFLKQDTSLSAIDSAFFVLNPKQVKGFKKAYSDLPKTDPVDAFVIADCLRFGRIGTKEAYMDDFFVSLQKLTRARFHISQDLAAEKNRYLNSLFLKFSEMAQTDLFSDNFGVTAMALIERYETVDDLASAPIEELAAFVNDTGKGKFVDPDLLAHEIQSAAKASYRLPKTVVASVNQALAVSARTIRFYEKQMKELDKAISDLVSSLPGNPLATVAGIGPVYSAGILAEIGDIHRFKDQAALAKYAGLSWSRHQSGEFDADHTHLIPSGNRYLRYFLIQAANKVRMHDPDYSAFYQKKLAETKTTPHKRALVLTARKLVRLVFALLRDNKFYIPSDCR